MTKDDDAQLVRELINEIGALKSIVEHLVRLSNEARAAKYYEEMQAYTGKAGRYNRHLVRYEKCLATIERLTAEVEKLRAELAALKAPASGSLPHEEAILSNAI